MLAFSGCTAHMGASREVHAIASAAQIRVAQTEALLADSEKRIRQLEEAVRLQGRTAANRMESAGQIDEEIARLRGEIEVLVFQMEELQLANEQLQVSGEARQLHDEMRLAQLEAFLGLEPPPAPTMGDLGLSPVGPVATEADKKEASTEAVQASSASELLELARGHVDAGRTSVARVLLERAVKEYPGAEELAEVRFLTAEILFSAENWRSAANAYQAVSDHHPGSAWSCRSLLRQGACFDALGRPDAGRLFYEGAMEGHCRGSEDAAEAERRLQQKP